MKNRAGVYLFFFSLGLLAGAVCGALERTHKSSPVSNVTPDRVETWEPPLAIGAEPKDPAERIGWIERIVERRMARAFESDPDAKGGPFVDMLAVKLAAFVRRLLKVALELAIAAAIGFWLWNHWYILLAWVAAQTGLSWLIGAKKS